MSESIDERCDCGKLLLRKTSRGFEMKCNRCKRIHLIPYDMIAEDYTNLCPAVEQLEKRTEARDHQNPRPSSSSQ